MAVVAWPSGNPTERVALVSPSGEKVGYAEYGGGVLEAWVERPLATTEVGCRLHGADGRIVLVGPYPLDHGTGWWRVKPPIGDEIRTLELIGDGDQVVAIARFV
jgi:hypothetical protein